MKVAEPYSQVVRDVVIEADRRAAARRGRRQNKGEALAHVLAEDLGIDYRPTAVRAWMRGDTKPPPDVLLAVAANAGISLDERLGIGREPTEVELQLAQVQDELVRQSRRLDELAAIVVGRAAGSVGVPSIPDPTHLESAVSRLEREMASIGRALHRSWRPATGTSRRDTALPIEQQLRRRVGRLMARTIEARSIVGLPPTGDYPPDPDDSPEAVGTWLGRAVAVLERESQELRGHPVVARGSSEDAKVG